jgi:hypothetical protein
MDHLQTELRDIAQNMQKLSNKWEIDVAGKTQDWIDDAYKAVWEANYASLY